MNVLFTADFGMDDREMMRDASTFEEDLMHGATASNLLLEAEPGPANLPDKSNHMEYDDFGDASMGNSDGGMLGKQSFSFMGVEYHWLFYNVQIFVKLTFFLFQLTNC